MKNLLGKHENDVSVALAPSCLDDETPLIFVTVTIPARLTVQIGLELINVERLNVPLVLKTSLRSSEGHVLGHLQM